MIQVYIYIHINYSYIYFLCLQLHVLVRTPVAFGHENMFSRTLSLFRAPPGGRPSRQPSASSESLSRSAFCRGVRKKERTCSGEYVSGVRKKAEGALRGADVSATVVQ